MMQPTSAPFKSPAMLRYSTQNYAGSLRNMGMEQHHVEPELAAHPGQSRFGALMSLRAFGGFGAGSSGCWVDPDHDVAVSFLSTGLLEGSYHVERTGALSDMIISSLF